MENKRKTITVELSPEDRYFLDLLKHEDAAKNLPEAIHWCIDSCMRIEKLYGIDACYIAYNDIRKPENDPNPPVAPQPLPLSDGLGQGEEWDSVRLIGRARERHQELIEKGHEWRAFYTGWMEGRGDMLGQILGLTTPSPKTAEGEVVEMVAKISELLKTNPTISELVDKSLQLGLAPIIEYISPPIPSPQTAEGEDEYFIEQNAALQDDLSEALRRLRAANARITDLEEKLRGLQAERDHYRTSLEECERIELSYIAGVALAKYLPSNSIKP